MAARTGGRTPAARGVIGVGAAEDVRNRFVDSVAVTREAIHAVLKQVDAGETNRIRGLLEIAERRSGELEQLARKLLELPR